MNYKAKILQEAKIKYPARQIVSASWHHPRQEKIETVLITHEEFLSVLSQALDGYRKEVMEKVIGADLPEITVKTDDEEFNRIQKMTNEAFNEFKNEQRKALENL